jgi:hypothetical protein
MAAETGLSRAAIHRIWRAFDGPRVGGIIGTLARQASAKVGQPPASLA